MRAIFAGIGAVLVFAIAMCGWVIYRSTAGQPGTAVGVSVIAESTITSPLFSVGCVVMFVAAYLLAR